MQLICGLPSCLTGKGCGDTMYSLRHVIEYKYHNAFELPSVSVESSRGKASMHVLHFK